MMEFDEIFEHCQKSSRTSRVQSLRRGINCFTPPARRAFAIADLAGRIVRTWKAGSTAAHLAPILDRLGIAQDEFIEAVEKFPQWFRRFAGTASELAARAKQVGRKSLHGISKARRLFKSDE